MSTLLGYVTWWCPTSGEGEIHCPAKGQSFYVHWSAIKAAPPGLAHSIKNLRRRFPVEFTLYVNLYMSQVDAVWPLEFNYTVSNEHKLARLMNDLWDAGDTQCFDLSDLYYGGVA